MAVSFPLYRSFLSDNLREMSLDMKLQGMQDITTTGAGEIIVADLGPKVWVGEVRCGVLTFQQAADLQARIELLDESQQSFYFTNVTLPYPFDDPNGSILDASGRTPKIAAIASNNKEIKIKDLPNGYTLRRGNFFHFDFGTDPVHRAFHRWSTTQTADGTGDTDWIEVRPHIRPGAAVNDIITIVKPALEAKIVPNSFQPGTARGMVVEGMSFQFRQVI